MGGGEIARCLSRHGAARVSKAVLIASVAAYLLKDETNPDGVDTFGKTDFRPDLGSSTMPSLVIHGTADKTVPINPSGRAAVAGISGAKLIEYDGEPHGLFATAPQRLNSHLLEFLSCLKSGQLRRQV